MIDPGALITVFFFKSPLLIIIIRPLIDTVICVKEFLITSKCMYVFLEGIISNVNNYIFIYKLYHYYC